MKLTDPLGTNLRKYCMMQQVLLRDAAEVALWQSFMMRGCLIREASPKP
jgi:hypothetical protein